MKEGVLAAERSAAYGAARELLEDARRLVLTTHVQPDGDGIGSEAALARHLRGIGKEATILNPHPTPRRFRFLEPEPPIVAFEPEAAEAALSGTDLLVVLDISVRERLGRLEPMVMRHAPPTLIIDHHAGLASIQGFDLRDTGAAATGELVYRLLKGWDADLTPEISTALYAAIAYDTGGFRYSNTREVTHEIAADLIRNGADAAMANHHLFESVSRARVRLLVHALASFELSANGRVASVILPQVVMEKARAENEDVEGIVEALRSIEGVEVAIVLKEVSPHATKVSFRSAGPLDVRRFAREFGGGGHRNAAGAYIHEPLASVVARVVPAAHAEFDSGPAKE